MQVWDVIKMHFREISLIIFYKILMLEGFRETIRLFKTQEATHKIYVCV